MVPGEIDLREFDKLRDEIVARQHSMMALWTAEITVLAASVSFAQKLPEVLVGGAAASICIWMGYVGERRQVNRLGAYIRGELAPRLQTLHPSHPNPLGWEEAVLTRKPKWIEVAWRDSLFVLASIALLVTYVVEIRDSWSVGQLVLVGGVVSLFLLAGWVFVSFKRELKETKKGSEDVAE
jgi:hypothetical protein